MEVISHWRVKACAMMVVPALFSTSLPPVWSQCQCVLKAVFTLRVPVAACTAASSAAVYSAAPVSTIRRPSALLPSVTTLPPAPAYRKTSSASRVAWTDAGTTRSEATAASTEEPSALPTAPAMAACMNFRRSVIAILPPSRGANVITSVANNPASAVACSAVASLL